MKPAVRSRSDWSSWTRAVTSPPSSASWLPRSNAWALRIEEPMPKLARTRNATAGMTRTAISLERTRQLRSPSRRPGSRSFGRRFHPGFTTSHAGGWLAPDYTQPPFHIRHRLGEMSTMRAWSRILFVVLVVLAAGCTGSEPESETTSVEEVRIGVLAPSPGRQGRRDRLGARRPAGGQVPQRRGGPAVPGRDRRRRPGLGRPQVTVIPGDTAGTPPGAPVRPPASSPPSGSSVWSAPTTPT